MKKLYSLFALEHRYAMPRLQSDGTSTDVRDPWSIGLATFSNFKMKGPWPSQLSLVRAHGVDVYVASDQWQHLKHQYKDGVLSHPTSFKGFKCGVGPFHRHNCQVNKHGTHLNTCMEYTGFGMSTVHEGGV